MGLNLWNFVSQVITFLVLLWILAKYVFPVLIKTMDKREQTIREGVVNAEKARQELNEAQKRVEALLDEARRDAQATLAKATQAAEHVRQDIEQDAQRRAREIITQAEQRTQQLVAQARAQLRQDVADLAIAAAEHVVGNSLDTTTSRRLVNEFVAQSRDVQC
ncbi:MAG TPA: F0F1 ATP synthase subunit B [Ktedonobacterales bacterium]|jgi:F-type H+-transporting ATPase subunit b|nr:F0F1 ATP synthase subunit B [Ktedonobacterales bacterium]